MRRTVGSIADDIGPQWQDREMRDTAARLLRLLGLLQRRPTWSGAELAERLGVDERTVRRDVERLRGLGYQVDSSPGAGGGYRLGVGASMPPLLLEDDEATAVAVVLGIMAGIAVPGIERGALDALTKLDRLLPTRLKGQLAALRTSTVTLLPPMDAVPADQLVALARACDGHLLARFNYRSREEVETERRVEPHRLVATGRRWYLVGFDLDRGAWRTFRVDRTSAVEVTGHTFTPRALGDAGRLVAEGLATAPYRRRARVAVAAPPEELARRVGRTVGVVSRRGDHSLLELGFDEVQWLAGYLLALELPFEVLEPEEARSGISELGRRLAAAHEPSRPGGAGRYAPPA